jgi:hypothetical protein
MSHSNLAVDSHKGEIDLFRMSDSLRLFIGEMYVLNNLELKDTFKNLAIKNS